MKPSRGFFPVALAILMCCVTTAAAEPAEMRQLPVIDATAETFKPFGQLVETPKSDPMLKTGWVPAAGTYQIDGETAVSIWSRIRHNEPLVKMERHLKTPEIYVAVEGDFIFPVTKPLPLDDPDLQPSVEDVVGLRVKEGQTLIMKPGMWHWGPWPVSERCSIVILFKKDTEKNDLPIKPFKDGMIIAAPGTRQTESKPPGRAAVGAGAAEPNEPMAPHEVIQLFNGRDLSGWTTWLVDTKHEDPRGVFSVQDGKIHISGDGFGYLGTTRAFKDYRLVAEVKWGSRNYRTRIGMARDSGIFLHSVGPEGNTYDRGWGSRERNTGPDISNGAYKAAVECQVMEGGVGDLLLIHGRYADGGKVPVSLTASAVTREVADDYAKYQFDPKADKLTLGNAALAWLDKDTAWRDVPGFRGRRDVESPLGEWTRIECVCEGGRITNFVNGKRVNEADEVFPAAGKILLQCEGSEIFFRKIELHPLAKKLHVK